MGTNTATVELTSVKKREKTKQRQNENSTLCCSNICCSCPVTKSFTNTNKFFNKSTYNSIKGNIYNRIKQTANNNKQPTSNNLWSIFIWSSCNFFSIYQFYG